MNYNNKVFLQVNYDFQLIEKQFKFGDHVLT